MARDRIQYKTREQMRLMALAGVVVERALAAAASCAVEGATTRDLDRAATAVIREHGATASFLGYHGYPATICVSINDEIVHGIPGDRTLADGDIVSIDCGAIVQGWHGDSALTVIVGTPQSAEDEALVSATREGLWDGIAALATARTISDVAGAIDDAAMRARVVPVEGYVGHGIGTEMHQDPEVPNERLGGREARVRPGLCVAIEPMFALGGRDTLVLDDDWTVTTADGSRAAHWEHSVALHEGGIWVLTASDGGAPELGRRGIIPVAP
jgi:methionyl aminopeptidase